ncbi:hypothetical protein C8Q72DRAFT_821640 [Fomitopsis betulina]|nr:hypothetical protein C8Q72DRAFT_821640 [Fomitopsis betulina]
MSSADEYSDDDVEYYDEDDEMVTDDDGSASEMELDPLGDINEGSSKRKVYEVDYESLSQAEVEKQMQEDVDYITSIFGVTSDVASLLLRHFDWNREKLIEKYMDNTTTVSVAAGIMPPEKAPRRPAASATKSSKSKVLDRTAPLTQDEPAVCLICFDDTQTDFLSLVCNHKFCKSCWAAYIESKVKTEAESWITCMAEDCNVVATNGFIKEALAQDKPTWDRFHELLVRHYVSHRPELKYCPYPACTHTVSCSLTKASLTTQVPIVACGNSAAHKFCFGCNVDSDHRPVVCAVAKMWLQKCHDDSETANWIKSNTKECSKCQSTIEKNGGCNHMTCKKCKYEFCWVCMGPWSEHGTSWYNCNRFDEKASKDARDAQSRSRASLERYLHYYNRWANHEQSKKLSVELYAKTEKKMEEMQMTSELSWIEVQFMKKAVDEVIKCRTTLMWTYGMAYYLDSSNEKELFEDNQRDLERAVEDLSELVEGPLDPEVIKTLRQKVTDRTVYVTKRNEIMLEDTARGFLEGRWTWNLPVVGLN